MLRPISRPVIRASSSTTSSLAKTIAASKTRIDLQPYLSCSMPCRKLRVTVLLSGGVDSSVSLRLLHATGHHCTAFYLKILFQRDLLQVTMSLEQFYIDDLIGLHDDVWNVAYLSSEWAVPDFFNKQEISFRDYLLVNHKVSLLKQEESEEETKKNDDKKSPYCLPYGVITAAMEFPSSDERHERMMSLYPKYEWIRQVLSDDDQFYCSFLFAYLENIWLNKDFAEVERVAEKLATVGVLLSWKEPTQNSGIQFPNFANHKKKQIGYTSHTSAPPKLAPVRMTGFKSPSSQGIFISVALGSVHNHSSGVYGSQHQ